MEAGFPHKLSCFRGFYVSYHNKEAILVATDPHSGNLHKIP